MFVMATVYFRLRVLTIHDSVCKKRLPVRAVNKEKDAQQISNQQVKQKKGGWRATVLEFSAVQSRLGDQSPSFAVKDYNECRERQE